MMRPVPHLGGIFIMCMLVCINGEMTSYSDALPESVWGEDITLVQLPASKGILGAAKVTMPGAKAADAALKKADKAATAKNQLHEKADDSDDIMHVYNHKTGKLEAKKKKRNSLKKNVDNGDLLKNHTLYNPVMGRKYVLPGGYTSKDQHMSKNGHYYIGNGRRRIGAGFGRRRRTPYVKPTPAEIKARKAFSALRKMPGNPADIKKPVKSKPAQPLSKAKEMLGKAADGKFPKAKKKQAAKKTAKKTAKSGLPKVKGGAKSKSKAKSQLLHAGQDCWRGCYGKQGPCSWCGNGVCCRKGWRDKSNGCDGTLGIKGKGHVCVDASITAKKWNSKTSTKELEFKLVEKKKKAELVQMAAEEKKLPKGLVQPLPSTTGTSAIAAGVKKDKQKIEAKKLETKGDTKGWKAAGASSFTKNCAFLNAFSHLAKGKLSAKNYASLNAVGALLKGMSQKSKKTPGAQYKATMHSLRKKYRRGLGRYVIHHISKAMRDKGVVSLGAVSGKSGLYMRFEGRDLGLTGQMRLLEGVGVRLSNFVAYMKKLTGKVSQVVAASGSSAQHFTREDYTRIFRPACVSKSGGTFKSCSSKGSKSSCRGANCKWVGSWKGNELN
jgi:hypothetical protein